MNFRHEKNKNLFNRFYLCHIGCSAVSGSKRRSSEKPQFCRQRGIEESGYPYRRLLFFQTNKLGKEWELKAKKAELFEFEKRANLEEIQVIIHTESGMEISFEGESGTIDTRQKNFHLENKKSPIRIRMSSGYTIEVMEADWNNEKKEIVSESPITVHGENWEIKGKGLILKTKSEEFVIEREVEAKAAS